MNAATIPIRPPRYASAAQTPPSPADVAAGDAQFPGWPITFKMDQNDGREATHWLPELKFTSPNPVVQVVEEVSGEILYTVRARGNSFQPRVYGPGKFTIKVGNDEPNGKTLSDLSAGPQGEASPIQVEW